MVDQQQLELIQSLLAAPSLGKCPSPEEKSAWLLLYGAHTKLIRSVLKRHGVNESDIDDLEQQVWVALLRRLGKSKKVFAAGDMSEYIRKSARREAARHLHRYSKRLDSLMTAELESTLLDPEPGPLSEYERQERRERARTLLKAARAALSDEDHRMLVMHCIDGLAVREIAAQFFISADCAKKRLQRAVQAIKALPLRREDW